MPKVIDAPEPDSPNSVAVTDSRQPTAASVREAHLTEPELTAWGERIGREVEPPVVLARAITRGTGEAGVVPSPTFNLLFHYESPRGVDVYHLDLYRIEEADEVWELGWVELDAGPNLVLIEWPERAEALLPRPRWEVRLEEVGDPARRRVALHAVGEPPALPPFPAGAEAA